MGIVKERLYANALEIKNHEEPRLYIGFSSIGHICRRYLWLDYHKNELKSQFNEKQAVIFDNGHWVEKKLIHNIRQAGFEISAQQMEMSLFDGKFKGHSDGIINHPEYGKVVLEIKGIQKNTWNQYVKKGIKEISPTYYAQAIMYSGYLNLSGTLFVIENKDNQDLYEEFIPSNFTEYNMLCRKAESIIHGEIPAGISTRVDWWQCTMCDFNNDNACRKDWNKERLF